VRDKTYRTHLYVGRSVGTVTLLVRELQCYYSSWMVGLNDILIWKPLKIYTIYWDAWNDSPYGN
jgi:hypothetical protein